MVKFRSFETKFFSLVFRFQKFHAVKRIKPSEVQNSITVDSTIMHHFVKRECINEFGTC